MSKITVENDGETFTHIGDNVADYATLCGIDGHDPEIGQRIIPTPRGQKIDCPHCWGIWKICREYAANNFEKTVQEK